MASISNLGYFVLGVSDLDAWETFAVDVIGLQPARRVPGVSLALRMDDYEQRILLEKNSDDDMLAAGWELDSEAELELFVAQLKTSGVQVTAGSTELAANRRVERVYYCTDPVGIRHEFYACAQRAAVSDSFRSKVLAGQFSTGKLGAGHYVMSVQDLPEMAEFCQNVLGIKISDYISGDLMPGKVLDVIFYHATSGRHHSLATAKIPFPYPKRIHHFMVEAMDMNDVGLAYDRCLKAGYTINMDLGHHPNDKMFSFYVHTPSGFLLEFGSGGIVVDDTNWQVSRYSQLSDWGHHHPEPKAATQS